jgi:hypothetical protein
MGGGKLVHACINKCHLVAYVTAYAAVWARAAWTSLHCASTDSFSGITARVHLTQLVFLFERCIRLSVITTQSAATSCTADGAVPGSEAVIVEIQAEYYLENNVCGTKRCLSPTGVTQP